MALHLKRNKELFNTGILLGFALTMPLTQTPQGLTAFLFGISMLVGLEDKSYINGVVNIALGIAIPAIIISALISFAMGTLAPLMYYSIAIIAAFIVTATFSLIPEKNVSIESSA